MTRKHTFSSNSTIDNLRDEINRLKNEAFRMESNLTFEIETLKRENKKLQELVVLDSLTQVTNRRGFTPSLERIISQLPLANGEEESRRATLESCGLLMLDVDHFKATNDNYGHPFGDQVLVAIAHALKNTVRTFDRVCRYGGEEFVIILPGVVASGLEIAAEKIRAAVAALRFDEHSGFKVTVSIGGSIQFYQTDEKSIGETLINQADSAMYCSKQTGRNRFTMASEL